MPLISDIQLLDANRAAAQLLAASQALRAQQSQVQTDIGTKKPLVKADIENNVWVFADIKEVIDLISLNQALNQQKAANKSDLQNIRTVITDPVYISEILAEEALL